MKKFCVSILIGAAMALCSFAQEKSERDADGAAEARREFREQIQTQKKNAVVQASRSDASPADFWDTDSFGKNVQFLGSFYAGTVYLEPDCSAAALAASGITLAPDDHCVVKTTGVGLPSQVIFDPTWQMVIPGKSAKNVIYLLLNNSVDLEAFNPGPANGTGGGNYSPQVTLVSEALNDPAAINPNTNTPMNGSFTTSLPGQTFKSYTLPAGQSQIDVNSYASVNGRGFSRSYFQALGLPERVIDNIFKKDLTLKFGIRFSASQKTDYASFFYQFRVLGQ